MKRLAAIVTLALAGMAHAGEVKLAWNANPGAEMVTEYRVWRGIECLATVTVPQATLTLQDAPAVLTVTARNAAGESAHSAPLEIIAVTLQTSPDLSTWSDGLTRYFEKRQREFYRLGFKGPEGGNITVTYQVEVRP